MRAGNARVWHSRIGSDGEILCEVNASGIREAPEMVVAHETGFEYS